MNDFTKDELKWLQEGINELITADSCTPERIWLKLKNMIDNYCEHSESIMDCDGGITLVCKECGAITMDI